MKASSVALLTQCRRLVDVDIPEKPTTPLPDDDHHHRDIHPLALWNACATSPISISADAIMCNQGSPPRRRSVADNEEDDEEEDGEASRSGGEESSLWLSGKQIRPFPSFRSMSRWRFIATRSTNAGFSGSPSSMGWWSSPTEVDGDVRRRKEG
jgi:hypothetical protein